MTHGVHQVKVETFTVRYRETKIILRCIVRRLADAMKHYSFHHGIFPTTTLADKRTQITNVMSTDSDAQAVKPLPTHIATNVEPATHTTWRHLPVMYVKCT